MNNQKPDLLIQSIRFSIIILYAFVGICFAQTPIPSVAKNLSANSHISKVQLKTLTQLTQTNSIIPLQSIPNSPAVGTLPGKLQVTPSGAATYNIPIATPPGTAGITPKISIEYNSQQKNGLLGMGFSLQGLTAITRGAQNKAQNGKIHAVDFTDADRFTLNGDQLVAVEGTYGQDNTEYRTYNDSHAKIISHGRSGHGPASFTVYTKGGQIAEYGITPNSQLKAHTITPTGTLIDNQTIKTWALTNITDRAGNYLNISYGKDDTTGELYPIEIDYTGNKAANVAPYNSVRFSYIDRSKAPFSDVETKWHEGSKSTLSKLLSEIKIYQGKTKVYDYKLTYEASPNTDRSRLVSIQECNGNGVCLPATTFNWQTNAKGWTESKTTLPGDLVYVGTDAVQIRGKLIDMNGNGSSDYLLSYLGYSGDAANGAWLFNHENQSWEKNSLYKLPVSTPMVFETHHGPSQRGNFADINGNGLSDYIFSYRSHNGKQANQVYLNTGTHWEKAAYNFPTTELSYEGNDFPQSRAQLVDLNGDGLSDVILSYQGYSGDSEKGAWINTGNGWTSDNSYTLPEIKLYTNKNGPIQRGFFADVNGNGLPDYIVSYRGYAGDKISAVWLNQGSQASQKWLRAPYPFPTTDLSYEGNDHPQQRGTLVDLNGDGLPDILVSYEGYSGDKESQAWINIGTGWIPDNNYKLPKPMYFETKNGIDQRGHFVDLTGNGLLDYVYSYNSASYGCGQDIYLNTGHGWQKTNDYQLGDYINWEGNDYSESRALFTDVNGTGLADAVFGYRGYSGDSIVKTYMHQAKKAPDMLIGITNGLGEKTAIDYEPISNAYVNVYSQEKKADGTLDSNYPNPQFVAPMYVVYQTASSTGTNDPQTLNKLAQYNGATLYNPPQGLYSTIPNNNNPNDLQHITTYHYTGARLNKLGWGFLGFHKVQITDNSTGISNTTTYSQDADNHLAHHPLETDTYSEKGVLLTSKKIDWQVKYLTGEDIEVANKKQAEFYLPYTSKITTKHYDLNSGNLLSTQTVEQQLEEVSQNNNQQMACYGNIATVIQTITDSTGTYTTESKNTYSNDPTHWLIGALTKSVVTKTNPDGAAITRTSEFNYDTNGFLQQTITEPNDPALSVTKTVNRDVFGNIISTTNSWLDPITKMQKSTTDNVTYDTEGRFILTKTNALQQTTSQTIDPKYGTPLKTTDLNGLVTTHKYDGFGRLIETDHPDGTITKLVYNWSNPTINLTRQNTLNTKPTITDYTVLQNEFTQNPKLVTIGIGMDSQPIKTVYQISTQKFNQNGQPISGITAKYYDTLNRQVATTTQSFDGKTIWKDTFYDDLGRVIQQSVPFFAGTDPSQILYTRFKYDALGRVTDTTNPDNSKIHVDYDNYTTVTTNPLGQKSTKITNAMGKIIKTIDNAGTITTFDYGPYGNMVLMKDNQEHASTITYDKLGRKIAISDPDKGHWSYAYNPIGELIQQTDANGQVTTFKYDDLARLIQRTDNAGTPNAATSTWEYDHAKYGVGLLTTINGVSNQSGGSANASDLIQAEKSGLVNYRRTIQYDSLSRPISTTIILNGQSYTTSNTYDENGRINTTTRPNGLTTQNIYNDLGFLVKVINAKTQKTYWQLNQMDAQGHITSFTRNNGMTTTKTYDPATDFLVTIKTTPTESLALQQKLLPETKQATEKTNQRFRIYNQNQKLNNRKHYHKHSLDKIQHPAFNTAIPFKTSTNDIQDLQFSYDYLGNVLTRKNHVTSRDNEYKYDNMNRLSAWIQNDTYHSYGYDTSGNLIDKWIPFDCTYAFDEYDAAGHKVGPHAVTSAYDQNGKTIGWFTYNKNGDQIKSIFKGETRNITYSSFDKPLQINTSDTATKKDKYQVNFYYNADRKRFERIDTNKKTGDITTTLYLGDYELVVHNHNGALTTEEKNYVGSTLVIHTINSDKTTTDKTYEILTDNLGSTTAIADETGAVVQRFQYTPYGKQELISQTNKNKTVVSNKKLEHDNTTTQQYHGTQTPILTHHGFTGHEELEDVNLIHMNGRLYDPEQCRFLSPDPKIQDPTNSQSLNRYSYCLDNPLAYTDPTGFSWLGDLIHDVGHALKQVLDNQYVEIGIQIGINCIPGMQGWASAIAGAVWQTELTLINGGNVEAALKNGVTNFATSAAWIETGNFLGEITKGATADIAYGERVAVHGLVGGGIEAAEGGHFQDGFLVNAAAEALPIGSIGGKNANITPSIIAERAGASALVGGTIAAITGGNFADGAKTAAFAELFNDIAHEKMQQNAAASQRDTIIGQATQKSVTAGALRVDIYSRATLHEGNSNTEQIIDPREGSTLTIVKKLGFFRAFYGTDGSITHGTSMLSFGSTADGRYIVDISVPTGSRTSFGAKCYFNPGVITNNIKYLGNLVGNAFANPTKNFAAPDMPSPLPPAFP